MKTWRIRENVQNLVIIFAIVVSIISIIYSYFHGYIIAYGDSESHLNIAKRVIHSLTPGLAQIGGVWLPLPHLFMIPFTYFDFFWRTGIAGSIVSGISFVIACIFLYKLAFLLTSNIAASFIAFVFFAFNPNVLYMQSTPMTELPLITFFLLSSYFFFKFLKNDANLMNLSLASFFGFCATLTRYDGWFLVLFEALALVIFCMAKRDTKDVIEGKLVLFSSVAFLGIFLWILWDFLILQDPFYFTNSPFSAKSQQQGWYERGELLTYHNFTLSFVYYLITSAVNVGIIPSIVALVGVAIFFIDKREKSRLLMILIFFVTFFFNVVTLFVGQSIILIPQLTPDTFQWQLFNVRYGLMMVPTAAFFYCFVFHKLRFLLARVFLIILLVFQTTLFITNRVEVITLTDGLSGLSSSKITDAEKWMARNYDHGLVLLDDYARTLSIIKSNIPMENVIYIGNKPYWEESLREPESHARWIVLQRDDEVWKNIYDKPEVQARLYKYFEKAYTSPEILIFKKNEG